MLRLAARRALLLPLVFVIPEASMAFGAGKEVLTKAADILSLTHAEASHEISIP